MEPAGNHGVQVRTAVSFDPKRFSDINCLLCYKLIKSPFQMRKSKTRNSMPILQVCISPQTAHYKSANRNSPLLSNTIPDTWHQQLPHSATCTPNMLFTILPFAIWSSLLYLSQSLNVQYTSFPKIIFPWDLCKTHGAVGWQIDNPLSQKLSKLLHSLHDLTADGSEWNQPLCL